MKITASWFGLALLVGLTATSHAQETAQQFCPDMAELFTNPDYQAANCLIVDFPDDCGTCNDSGFANGGNIAPGDIDCNTMEEYLCPAVRCCENCWEKLQNYNQCFLVEPSWKSNGGNTEDGCVIDCSRFPIGGGDQPVDVNDSSPPEEDPPEPVDTTNSGIYVQDPELIENCRAARNNMICQIENCQECGDDGYPSVAATQLEALLDVGSFYTCGQMEEALCPEIRCCNKCDYTLSEFWFQCNVVESYKELGRTDFSCTIDCSAYDGGDTSSLAAGGTSEDTASATGNDQVEEDEEDVSEILDSIEDVIESIMGSSAPTVATSMLSWNIGILVLVGALARV